MKIIKAKLFKWLAGLFYRLSILTTGPITRKELAGIMESEMCALTPKSWWARIKREAYKREYSAYITALDSWACSETDDPFIGNKIIVDYYLNVEIFEYRNNRWGGYFKWGPYSVDRFAKHIAHSYKLGTIYRRDIL